VNISLTRLFAIMHKEVRQLRRDRLSFGMVVGIPILQVLVFGYAINTDVRNLRAGVADEAQTQLSRDLVADAQASQVVKITRQAATPQELQEALRRGEIAVGIHVPPDFERRLQQPDRSAAQLLVDGSDPVVLAAARQVSQMTMREGSAAAAPPKAALFEVYNPYNPERRSAIHIVPGLVGVILTMTMVLFTCVAIVRERERGNLELLINTPVRNVELMVGKLIPYTIIGLLQASLILILGRLLFQVPVVGSLLEVYVAALVFIAANLALGLVLSTVAKNQFQAVQMMILIFLPSILLSGFMFPFDGMPVPAQYLSEVLPLTHFLRLIRGIMLRGAGLLELWQELAALLAFAAVALTVAVLRFHKRLD
jgi:ABC-2 type transport system permease protein